MDNRIKFFLIAGALNISFFNFSCRTLKNISFSGGYISEYGRYITSQYIIDVSENPKGLLKYSLSRKDGTVLIDSDKDREISVYHKWRLYWDKDLEYLWLDSSDRGTFVWIKQADGSYTIKGFSPTEIPISQDKIPEDIKRKLVKFGIMENNSK